ncbi:MAG: tetratricopeptide repeat protein [Microscillaceae bacterium]|nr:tetratricopeptide repeat protein [Microscillaceae bacterium]
MNFFPSDTSEIESLINEAVKSFNSDQLKESRDKATEALDLSKKENYTLGQAKSSLLLGRIGRKLKKHNEASEFYLQSINYLSTIPNQHGLKLAAFTEMGFLHQEQEFHQTAVEYFKQAYELNKNTSKPQENYAILESMAISHLRLGKIDQTIKDYLILLSFYQKDKDEKNEIRLLRQIRDIYKTSHQYIEAIVYQEKILEIINKQNDGIALAEALNELGNLHQLNGDKQKALSYFSQAVLMNQNLHDAKESKKISSQNFEYLINLGSIHTNLGEYQKAEKYYMDAINQDNGEHGPVGIARVYNYLAANSLARGDYLNAKKQGLKAEEIATNYKADEVLLNSYKILTDIHQKTAETKKYEKYIDLYVNLKNKLENQQFQKQFDLFQDQLTIEKKENEFKLLLAEKEKQALSLKQYELEAEKKAKELALKEKELTLLKRNQELQTAALRNQQLEKERIQQILQITQQKSEASKQQQAIDLLEKNKKIQELALKEKTAKEQQRQKEIELLENEKKLQQLQLNEEANIRKYGVGVIILLGIIIVLVMAGFIQNRRKNIALAKQKGEIQIKNEQLLAGEEELRQNMEELEATQENIAEKNRQLNEQNEKIKANSLILEKAYQQLQKSKEDLNQKNEALNKSMQELRNTQLVLEHKNKALHHQNTQIRESLKYGHKIQSALLPQEGQLRDNFSDYFIFYRPKDIVSGDFFWFHRVGNKLFVAVVDCTGHGVPGAFMSVIGNKLLLEIVDQQGVYSPADILELLHLGIVSGLRQMETGNQDGMDVSLCRMEKLDTGKVELVFAGAKQSIFVFDQEIMELKGNRKSIGGFVQVDLQTQSHFEDQSLILNPDAVLYMTSDGLIDSPNPERKKFGRKRFRSFIEDHIHLPLSAQKDILIQYLDDFQQETIQRDDILVMGIKA